MLAMHSYLVQSVQKTDVFVQMLPLYHIHMARARASAYLCIKDKKPLSKQTNSNLRKCVIYH